MVHPALIPVDAVELGLGHGQTVPLAHHYGIPMDTDRLHRSDIDHLEATMAAAAGVGAHP